ncbi:MAG TPA: CHAD domain-containing protein [Steroidobacteraceae bacterium]|nr:CHAD domain-containing protein [Steroidobacteraceae bacterium]
MPQSAGQPIPTPVKPAGDAGAEARELEWQLDATDLGVVRHWLGRHSILDGLRIEPLPAQQLHDVYLDTADWRIFRAGYALRVRQKEGHFEATLKGLRSARADVADRRELTEPLTEGKVKALARAAGPVANRVRDVAGAKPLRTLFEVRTSRERFAVQSRDGAEEVGELALDEAHFSRTDDRRPITLTRVELEAVGPGGAALEQLAARLRTDCGLEPATENKFAAGLHSAALEPPRPGKSEREPLEAAMDASRGAGEFAAAALCRLVEEWQAHEPAARLGETPEALHALRVTGRRMDTVLGLFGAYLPAALVKSRSKLKKLLDALGAVRDGDIRLEAAQTFGSSLPEDDRLALDPLLRHLESERQAARSVMLRALDAKPTRNWLESLPARLRRPTPAAARAASGRATALLVVPDLIRKSYRKLRKCASRLTAESSISEYHKVRVRTKKLRYALEVVASTYARSAEDMLAALLKLQSRLGTQHDSDVLARYLTELAAHPPAEFGPRTLFLMGRMSELRARKAAQMGGKIEKSWRKVRGKRWKALRARMKELRDAAPETGNDGADRSAEGGGMLAHASGS